MQRKGIDHGRTRLMTLARRVHKDDILSAIEILEALDAARPASESVVKLRTLLKYHWDEVFKAQRDRNIPAAKRHADAAAKLDARIQHLKRVGPNPGERLPTGITGGTVEL